MKFSEVLSQAIELAKKANVARAQRARASAGFPAVTSGVQGQGIQVLGQPNLITVPTVLPEEKALLHFLESQSPETVYMLTAVMYLGRGDFETGKLLENRAIMGERFGGPKWAAGRMADKTVLPQYLEEGLRKATQAKIDLDAMVTA